MVSDYDTSKPNTWLHVTYLDMNNLYGTMSMPLSESVLKNN